VRVEVVGAPIDLGAARRGTDMGPSALRYARLHEAVAAAGHAVRDLGNLHVPVPESRAESRGGLRYLPEVAAVCRELAASVEGTYHGGAFPLILGGDHSIAIGSLAGRRRAGGSGGLLWCDAHGDFNTEETSPTGNIHGMPLAVAIGRGAPELTEVAGGRAVDPAVCAVVGVRSLDPDERRSLHQSGIAVFTMKEIDQLGMAAIMEQALRIVTGGGAHPFHLSFDLDVLDPVAAPGVGTPVPGGLTYREAHLAMELAADSRLISGMDCVEVNPILDERNRTARLAVELIASALGQRIY
jgi:arginase